MHLENNTTTHFVPLHVFEQVSLLARTLANAVICLLAPIFSCHRSHWQCSMQQAYCADYRVVTKGIKLVHSTFQGKVALCNEIPVGLYVGYSLYAHGRMAVQGSVDLEPLEVMLSPQACD